MARTILVDAGGVPLVQERDGEEKLEGILVECLAVLVGAAPLTLENRHALVEAIVEALPRELILQYIPGLELPEPKGESN
jgi:hypothetical protein